jgi:hypothetical protein
MEAVGIKPWFRPISIVESWLHLNIYNKFTSYMIYPIAWRRQQNRIPKRPVGLY